MAPKSIDPDRAGIAVGARLYAACMLQRPPVGWLEIDAGTLLASEPARRAAAALRAGWPVGLRDAGFALGAAGGLEPSRVDAFAALVSALEPARITAALAWTDGTFPNPALPLPYDDATLARVGADIDRLQARLNRAVLVENPPGRPRATPFASDEAQFLTELAWRTGCAVACDLANLHVSSANRAGDPVAWLAAMPGRAVGALRLAGHETSLFAGDEVLIADPAAPVSAPVWTLHELAARRFPGAPTLLAWDTPHLAPLAAEAARADRRRRAALDGGTAWADAPVPTRVIEFGSGDIVARSLATADQRQGRLISPGEPARRPAPDRAARVGGAVAAAETLGA